MFEQATSAQEFSPGADCRDEGSLVTTGFASALAGIDSGFRQLDRAAERIARDGAGGDLVQNLVDLQTAQHTVRANLATVRTLDETIGTLLDVLG